MDRIAALVDDALAKHTGSAMALSIGEAGREVARFMRGRVRRIPDEGPLVGDKSWFDVASLTKPMVTVACAMVMVGDGRLSLDAPVRQYVERAATTGTVRQLLAHCAGCAAHVEFFREMREKKFASPYSELVERAAREPGPFFRCWERVVMRCCASNGSAMVVAATASAAMPIANDRADRRVRHQLYADS